VKLRAGWIWAVALSVLPLVAQADGSPADSSDAVIKTEILSTRHMRINGYPYAYFTPETQLAFGVGGMATFYTSNENLILRPSSLTVSAYYTTNDQYKISLASQMFFRDNATFLSGDAGYGFYVDKFWGIGNEAPDLGLQNFTRQGWNLNVELQVPPIIPLSKYRKIGAIYDFRTVTIVDKEENPFLLDDAVPGSEGGLTSGLGLILAFDNRNNVFYPTHGGWFEFKAIFYGSALGSDFDFQRYTLNLRQYVGIANKKMGQVLGFQLFADFARGTTPFYELPALGGSMIMRGYFTGRYRDINYVAGQAEFRSYFWRRLGGVVFAGLGDVGHDAKPMSLDTIKYSVGIGLRFKFNQAENVNLRADIGFGEDTSGVYFGLEEAF
jgi:outer membrane protein assembly factor BamA